MDAAEAKLDSHHQLITIGQYLALHPAQRPAELTCAGTAAGQPCRGLVFAKAIHGGPIAPHFASRNHAGGCDHAAPQRAGWLEYDADSSAVAQVLQLTGTPSSHATSRQRPSLSPVSTAASPRASLRTVLRALTGAGLPPELVVRWHRQPPLLAYEFFIHLASAVTERGQDRGYWGTITTVRHHESTGSVHLVPKTGARIVIDARTSRVLAAGGSGFADLDPGSTVLTVGPLRRSRSGRAYVLVNQASALTWL